MIPYFSESRGDLFLVADVTRVKWDIVIALDNVKYRDDVATVKELLNDVPANKTTSTNNEVNVFCL